MTTITVQQRQAGIYVQCDEGGVMIVASDYAEAPDSIQDDDEMVSIGWASVPRLIEVLQAALKARFAEKATKKK